MHHKFTALAVGLPALGVAWCASSAQAAVGNTTVRTVGQLRSALANAHPGVVITVADGTYRVSGLTASARGTARAPITLRASRRAVIRTSGIGGGYGLHITGPHWHVDGISIAYASKGIVLDRAPGTVIEGVEIHDVADEGVHLRTCSSAGVLRNSYVHDTGKRQPQYGEGVYIGSAKSDWERYGCDSGRDGTHDVTVQGNTLRDVPAEGVDVKEGTVGGNLSFNILEHVGYSDANYAHSAVDVKGNRYRIEGNLVTGVAGRSRDGVHTHSVVQGWGTDNRFSRNNVVGNLRGVRHRGEASARERCL